MRVQILICLMLLAVPARAQDLMKLLENGPVVLVTVNDKGRFKSAQAVIHVKAPRDAIWRVATDFVHYEDFMPKLLMSDASPVSANVQTITIGLNVAAAIATVKAIKLRAESY